MKVRCYNCDQPISPAGKCICTAAFELVRDDIVAAASAHKLDELVEQEAARRDAVAWLKDEVTA